MRTSHPLVGPLTLGGYLRAARRARKLSRELLAAKAAVSTSYLRQLEVGQKTHPSGATLRALGTELGFGSTELRHVYDLAHVPASERDYPADSAVADETAVTSDMRQLLEHLEPYPAFFSDANWNLLAVNRFCEITFPGYTEAGNVLRWMFLFPQAKHVMVDWIDQAELAVQWFRASIAAESRPVIDPELVAELSTSAEFTDLWASQRVTFERQHRAIHLRDSATGERRVVYVQQYRTYTADDALLYLNIVVPGQQA